jgi:hypothetical protein
LLMANMRPSRAIEITLSFHSATPRLLSRSTRWFSQGTACCANDIIINTGGQWGRPAHSV